MDIDNLNATYPKYPKTVYDKGWTYGVWYCGTSWTKSEMYGQHPPTYLKRLCALFPQAETWLHAPGGIVEHGEYLGARHVTIDLVRRKAGYPELNGDVSRLPFPDASFDIVETDPPYGPEHDKVYGTPKYPRKKAMSEFRRILKPGGYLVWLDVRYPAYKRNDWLFVGLIGIVTGFERVTRILSIFQKPQYQQATLWEANNDTRTD